MAARDRSPEAVALAFVDRIDPGARHVRVADVAALVRAVRRECAAVAVGAVMGCPAFTDVQARLAADDVRVALRELNRAPRRGR